METFILVYFILILTVIGEKMYKLTSVQYPHNKKVTRFSEGLTLVIGIGMAIWSGYLIF
jgi:hypothetical protein